MRTQELITGYAVNARTLDTIGTIYVSKCSNGSIVFVLRMVNKTMSPMSDLRFRNMYSLHGSINRYARNNQIDSVRFVMAG
jgi:hypothetical protein